jgi:hypothetical protein
MLISGMGQWRNILSAWDPVNNPEILLRPLVPITTISACSSFATAISSLNGTLFLMINQWRTFEQLISFKRLFISTVRLL